MQIYHNISYELITGTPVNKYVNAKISLLSDSEIKMITDILSKFRIRTLVGTYIR